MKTPLHIALLFASSIGICCANSSTPEALAEDYMNAVLNKDASALRSTFVPLAKLNVSSQDRSLIESNWFAVSKELPFTDIDEVITEITPYDASSPKVHEPWRWPIAPTHCIRLRLKKDASWNSVEAAVEIDGEFYLVRPLPPNE